MWKRTPAIESRLSPIATATRLTAWWPWPIQARATCRSRPAASRRPSLRAYSQSPEKGISAGDGDTISFKTNKTGDFLWFCGVPGHGQSGMWIRFVVTGDAASPYVTIAPDAEPGRT